MVNSTTTTKTITIYSSWLAAMNGLYYGQETQTAENAVFTLREEERPLWLAEHPTPPDFFHRMFEGEERMQTSFAALCAMIREAEQKGNIVWLIGNDFEAWDQLNRFLASKELPEVWSSATARQKIARYGLFRLTDAVRDLGLPYEVFNFFKEPLKK